MQVKEVTQLNLKFNLFSPDDDDDDDDDDWAFIHVFDHLIEAITWLFRFIYPLFGWRENFRIIDVS